MSKQLEQIDFSGGIRAEKIQYNFSVLEEQLSRERLAIAGHGISSGLDFIIDKFNITIESGSLIGNNGKEVFLNAKSFKVELPRLSSVINEQYLVEKNGTITLPNIPYCLHRNSAVTNSSFQNGITITNYNNSVEKIPFKNIKDNILTIDDTYSGRTVNVSYSYTNKRYDTVYINLTGDIKILEGTTSSSPSILVPEDSMYILGYIEINPFFENELGQKVANLKLKKDLKSLRNIFTDKNNRLFICGVPFDNLQIIHMEQPTEPFQDQLWYDSRTNKLKVWKELDNIFQWVNVNDESTIQVEEVKLWEPNANPSDGKTFVFLPNEINYHFIPNKNCLDIRIDQGVLHKDQFDEITIAKAKEDVTLKEHLVLNYGYTEEFINSVNEAYENIGIGFMLATPLDKNCYVEAIISQRIHDTPIYKRFQRTATFAATDFFRVRNNEKVFTVKEYYRFKENQLEVFINGSKLTLGLDYIEGVDEAVLKQGMAINQFSIKKDIPENSIVSYKITTTIYSYDHINQVVGGLEERILEAEETVDNIKTESDSLSDFVNESIQSISSDVAVIKESDKEHSSFIKKTDTITPANLSQDILSKLQKGFINETIIKTTTQIVPLTDINPEDFIIAFDMSKSTGNNILKRIKNDDPNGSGDYYLERTSGTVNMVFKSASTVENNSAIYITGVKF